MFYRTTMAASLCAVVLFAETVLLKSGRSVEGTLLGGDARNVRVAVGESVQTFSVEEISSIRFGTAAIPSSPKPAAAKSGARSGELLRPSDRPSAAGTPTRSSTKREVPAGTALVVRMIDDVDSERDSVGQTFRATIDEEVVVGGMTAIPRNADAEIKLVDDKQAGRLSGRTELTLDIVSVTVNGRTLAVSTGEVTQQGESRTRETATRTGGGAALGAIIGAIAGGGKGAAIGAVTGAAAGGAVQVMTRGPKVRIPSESRLTFTLANPLSL
ncbi:MAG TPA: YMGG-like glycine zipper-containing protein [Bryobacteraceae bacterium]|nr:YMGG-like glycine zipper-containing protein [Bryobacteraceae bacterium]